MRIFRMTTEDAEWAKHDQDQRASSSHVGKCGGCGETQRRQAGHLRPEIASQQGQESTKAGTLGTDISTTVQPVAPMEAQPPGRPCQQLLCFCHTVIPLHDIPSAQPWAVIVLALHGASRTCLPALQQTCSACGQVEAPVLHTCMCWRLP